MSAQHDEDGHRRPSKYPWKTAVALNAVWVLLWGELSVANVASGLVVSALIFAVFPLPPIAYSGRIRPMGLLRLIWRFGLDLVVASCQVAALALRRGPPPISALVQVDLRSRSDLYLALTAELLTLLPGSIAIESRRSTSTLFIHVLDVRDEADVDRARRQALDQEARVVGAFGSSTELDAVRSDDRGGDR